MNSRHLKGADVKKSSTVWQQKQSLKSPGYGAINRLTGNDTRATGSANSFSCNTLQKPCTNSETNSTNGIKAFETPPHARLKKTNGAAPSTSREHQVVTPGRNVSLIMTPNSSKTPKTRRFPGPAGMLPKLVRKNVCALLHVLLSPFYRTTFLARYPFEFGPGA